MSNETEYSNAVPVDDDHHAAVMAALHKYEAPSRKEWRTMTQIFAVWKEALTTLGAVDGSGELNYPLSPTEYNALRGCLPC